MSYKFEDSEIDLEQAIKASMQDDPRGEGPLPPRPQQGTRTTRQSQFVGPLDPGLDYARPQPAALRDADARGRSSEGAGPSQRARSHSAQLSEGAGPSLRRAASHSTQLSEDSDCGATHGAAAGNTAHGGACAGANAADAAAAGDAAWRAANAEGNAHARGGNSTGMGLSGAGRGVWGVGLSSAGPCEANSGKARGGRGLGLHDHAGVNWAAGQALPYSGGGGAATAELPTGAQYAAKAAADGANGHAAPRNGQERQEQVSSKQNGVCALDVGLSVSAS